MASEDTEAKTLSQDVERAPSIVVMFVCASMCGPCLCVWSCTYPTACLLNHIIHRIDQVNQMSKPARLKVGILHHVLSWFVLEALTHTRNLPNSYSHASADAVIACQRVRRTKLLCRRGVETASVEDSDLENNSWSKWVGMQNLNAFTRLLWTRIKTEWFGPTLAAQENIESLGARIGILAILICGIVFIIGLLIDTKDQGGKGLWVYNPCCFADLLLSFRVLTWSVQDPEYPENPSIFGCTERCLFSCWFGLVVWVFIICYILIYFDQWKNYNLTLINLKNHQWTNKKSTHSRNITEVFRHYQWTLWTLESIKSNNGLSHHTLHSDSLTFVTLNATS